MKSDRRRSPVVVWLALLASVMLLLFGLNRGFDLTDESYYLAWIYDPTRFDASIHPFGLPLHLVYSVSGQSVVLLRLFGLILLLVTGALLGWSLSRFYREQLADESRVRLIPFGALAGLNYYALWIMTPNYNLLANASAAIVLAGTLEWVVFDREGGRGNLLASLLVGLGGCMAFFAKPTFAALCALAVATLLALQLGRHSKRTILRTVIVATSCIVPLVLIVIVTVGIAKFWSTVRIGIAVLNFGNSLGGLPAKTLGEFYHSPPIFIIILTCLALALARARDQYENHGSSKITYHMMLILLLVSIGVLVWSIVYCVSHRSALEASLGLPVICLVLSMLSYGLTRDGYSQLLRHMVPVLILAFLPFVIAFGTANAIFIQTGMSLFAPMLGLVIGSRLILSAAMARAVELTAALFVPAMLFWSSLFPYGLPRSLYEQSRPIALPLTSSIMLVDPATQRYVEGLQRLARVGQLRDCTPIIDLSGGGPGTALVLNDRAPFYPWLVHIFSGSERIADAAWKSMTPAQRNAAWIIGPVHPHFATTQIAHDLIERRNAYRLVGKVPMTFWGKPQIISVWRPTTGAIGALMSVQEHLPTNKARWCSRAA